MALVDHAKINEDPVETDLKVFYSIVHFVYLVSTSMVQIGNLYEPIVYDVGTNVKDDI